LIATALDATLSTAPLYYAAKLAIVPDKGQCQTPCGILDFSNKKPMDVQYFFNAGLCVWLNIIYRNSIIPMDTQYFFSCRVVRVPKYNLAQ
jgi:hypothetical protein